MLALTAPLPELMRVSCPHCQEGCQSCNGTAYTEVCSGCGFVPSVKDGYEVCACNTVSEVKRAA